MKTFRIIGMAIFAVLMCVNLGSCSSDDSEIELNEPQKPKKYVISFGFSGDISVSESPLSRNGTEEKNDLYGIQIYSCPNNESSITYTPYAMGLFDDVSSISVVLYEGYKYKFVASMVVGGKNIIQNHNGEYFYPFMWYGGSDKGGGIIDTEFEYSTEKQFISIDKGTTNLNADNKSYNIPNVDRYYGEVTDYIPIKNQSVTINMKRMVFGVKVISENLANGSLLISVKDAPQLKIVSPETFVEDIFTFKNLESAYNTTDYSETIEVGFKWIKSDGVEMPMSSHPIEFKRNKLTTINVKVSDNSIENKFGVVIVNETMGTGENITIENDKIIDTPVSTPI